MQNPIKSTVCAEPTSLRCGVLREGGNPTGALFAPLALLSLVYSRRKKRGTLDIIIILVVLGVALGMSLTACQQPTPSSPAPGGGNPPTTPPSGGSGPAGPTPTQNPTPQPRGTPTQIPTPCPFFANGRYDRQAAVNFAERNKVSYVDNDPDTGKSIMPWNPDDCTNFASYVLHAGGLIETSDWKPNPAQGAWIRTGELMTFLEQKGFTDGPIFRNFQSIDDTTKDVFLRENNPSSKTAIRQAIWVVAQLYE